MSEITFIKVNRSERMRRYARWILDEGVTYEYAHDYSYVELPIGPITNNDGERVTSVTRNQTVLLQAPTTVQPIEHYKCVVTINPEYNKYGQLPLMFMLDGAEIGESSPVRPGVYYTSRRDLPEELTNGSTWFCRIYLVS